MRGAEDALSLYRKGALLFITALAVLMTGGGLVYYAGYADSLFSNFASLLISGVGGYVLKNAFIPGANVALEVARAAWSIALTVVKQVLKLLLIG
jgi:hypothetical protein